jgi:hypothetical protein
MPKKSNKQKRNASRSRRPKLSGGVIAALALTLVAMAAAVTRMPALRRLYPAPAAPALQSQPNLQLSKEYVYAGGRLVATEEPTAMPSPTPAGAAPTGLLATATSAASVSLTWSASSGAVGYVVERRGATGIDEIPTGSSSPSFNDSPPAGDFAYIYRVKAVFGSGGTSAYGGADLTTTVPFTDDPLVGASDPQGRPPTPVRALHLQELRRAVEAVRTLANAGAASWKGDPAPLQGGPMQAAHFLELRTNLNPALSALGVAEIPADQTLGVGQRIKAAHLQDVRDRVR